MPQIAGLLVLFTAAGACLFLAFVFPLAASLWACASADPAPAGLDSRRLILLARGVGVALGSAALALVLGGLLAPGFGARQGVARFCIRIVALSTLLTPPYVIAYAWGLPFLPEGLRVAAAPTAAPDWLAGPARAITCLGTWLTPLSAFLLWRGWRVSGAPALALARADGAASWGALRVCVVPMGPWAGLALLASGLIAFTEFSVCHLCLVQTWNTEVLAQAQLLGQPGQALLLAWPIVAISAACSAGAWLLRRRLREALAELAGYRDVPLDVGEGLPRGGGVRGAIGPLVICGILACPWVILLAQWRRPAALPASWNTYWRDWFDGGMTALLAGGLCALLAIAALCATQARGRAAAWLRGGADVTLLLALQFAIAPPALVGDAHAASLALLPWIADSSLGVSLVGVARFAVIPLVALRLAAPLASAQLSDLAQADGPWYVRALRIQLPLCAAPLGAASACAALLAFGEVSASQMVRPAGVGSIALALLNEIHFGRNDEVIALCLQVLGLSCGLAWILAGMARKRR